MPKYDVLNQFIHPITGERTNPPGPVDLPDTDGKRLVQANCLRPATPSAPNAAGKKKASKKSARGTEG